MRSQVDLPKVAKLYPQYFRELGYYCTNNSKTDYNFHTPAGDIWNESSGKAHWRKRKEGQPFFAVFNFTIISYGVISREITTFSPYVSAAGHSPSAAGLPKSHPPATM